MHIIGKKYIKINNVTLGQLYTRRVQEVMSSSVIFLVLFALVFYQMEMDVAQLLDESCRSKNNFKIVGGKPAPINSRHWMAAIYNRTKDFNCGGTLITKSNYHENVVKITRTYIQVFNSTAFRPRPNSCTLYYQPGSPVRSTLIDPSIPNLF